MGYSKELPQYKQSRDFDLRGGANSITDGLKLPAAQYSWAENITNEGGDIATRWGFTNVLKFNCGRAQGFKLFQPTNTTIPNMYIAISGEIWISYYPYVTAQRITTLQFRPDVDMIVFKEATVANTPSKAVSPYKVLMMQDGITAPGYTDGTISRHLDPSPNGFFSPASVGGQETRIGLSMEFVGLRLWVASGKEVFASDIADPLHFIETTYLAGGGSFQAYDGDTINCLKRTADGKQLLLGTNGNTTALNAGNTVRSTWPLDPDFERLLFPGVGWTGPKCATEISGELMWMSKEGARFYNAVGQTAFSAKRSISSQEMNRSWENRGPLLSRCCAGSFEAYGLIGVPSGDQYNRHIWAVNTGASDLLTEQLPYAWLPIWKGVRPVEFDTGDVNGMNRMFCLEQGRDIPRVWELFTEKRRDYYQLGGILHERSIQCRLETRAHTFNELFTLKQISYSHLHLKGVLGNVALNAQYRNEFGCFRDFGTWNLCTTQCVTLDLEMCNFENPPENQRRSLRTTQPTPECNEGGSPNQTNIGTNFTYQLTWTGEMAIQGIDHFATQLPEPVKGACSPGDATCIDLSCCQPELDYWSAPEELFPNYYYGGECHVLEVTDE